MREDRANSGTLTEFLQNLVNVPESALLFGYNLRTNLED